MITQKIIQSFHLDKLSGSPDSLVTEILSWTGGNSLLTQYLCQVIVESHYFIPSGMESALVAKIVQERVITNWQTQNIAPFLNQIQEYFLTQPKPFSKALLLLYLKIWQQGSVIINHSPKTKELIALGLIIEQENQLKVANRLYRTIFDSDWVQKQLLTLESNTRTSSQLNSNTSANTTSTAINNPLNNSRLTQIVAFLAISFISLLGLCLVFVLVFSFDNSQPEFAPDNEIENSPSFLK